MTRWIRVFASVTCWTLLCASASSAAADQFRGRLDPKVAPGTKVLAPVTEAGPEIIAALPAAPAAGDTIWMLKRGPAIDIKGAKYLMALAVQANGERALWLDRNLNGAFDANERWAFPGDQKTVDLTLPWDNGIYREFPITFEYAVGANPSQLTNVVYNFNIVFSGSVDVDGRALKLQFFPLPAVIAIDPATIRTALDANGNGRIENEAGEMDTGRGKAPVFKSGSRYLAVKSVDLATGEIVVEERPASEYTRFDASPGQLMPDFTFVDFDGRARKLSDFRGRYVLLDFWGTWCGPCIAAMRELDPIYAQYAPKGFEIIGMNMEKTAGKLTAAQYEAVNATARAFIAKAGHKWLQATQESIERVALDVVHVNEYPTTILIGPDGTVVSREAHPKELTVLLAKLLR